MLKWIQFPKFPLAMLAYNICNYLKWIIIFLVKFEVKNLNLHYGYLQPMKWTKFQHIET